MMSSKTVLLTLLSILYTAYALPAIPLQNASGSDQPRRATIQNTNGNTRNLPAAIARQEHECEVLATRLSASKNKLHYLRRQLQAEDPATREQHRRIAIVNEFIGAYIGVRHGSTDHILSNDNVLIIRRTNAGVAIVADGLTYDVRPSHCAVKITRNLAGVNAEDEVYFLRSLASPFAITEFSLDDVKPGQAD